MELVLDRAGGPLDRLGIGCRQEHRDLGRLLADRRREGAAAARADGAQGQGQEPGPPVARLRRARRRAGDDDSAAGREVAAEVGGARADLLGVGDAAGRGRDRRNSPAASSLAHSGERARSTSRPSSVMTIRRPSGVPFDAAAAPVAQLADGDVGDPQLGRLDVVGAAQQLLLLGARRRRRRPARRSSGRSGRGWNRARRRPPGRPRAGRRRTRSPPRAPPAATPEEPGSPTSPRFARGAVRACRFFRLRSHGQPRIVRRPARIRPTRGPAPECWESVERAGRCRARSRRSSLRSPRRGRRARPARSATGTRPSPSPNRARTSRSRGRGSAP